jgi:hypothetical protein
VPYGVAPGQGNNLPDRIIGPSRVSGRQLLRAGPALSCAFPVFLIGAESCECAGGVPPQLSSVCAIRLLSAVSLAMCWDPSMAVDGSCRLPERRNRVVGANYSRLGVIMSIGGDLVGRLRHVHLWAAVIVCVSAGVLVITTFVLPGTSIPGACVWAAVGLTLPIFGAAVATAGHPVRLGSRDFPALREQNRLYWHRVRERIPWPVAVVIAAIFLFGWFAAMTGISQLTGVPERHGAHYFSDNHGVLTPLTQVEYERQLAAGYRGFAAVSMGLCAVAAGLVRTDPLRPEAQDGRGALASGTVPWVVGDRAGEAGDSRRCLALWACPY